MSTKINANTSGLTETVDTSGILEIQTAGGTAIIIGTDQNANFASTGAITVPVGTTSQRPTPVNGMMRYNSNVAVFEVYANNTWSAANVTPAPTNTVAPVISGSAIVGQNLTSTTGTWSGSPTGYYYQWKANSTSITGQTANVITLTLAENGANITCEVTAYNVAGNSTPATSNTLGPVIQGVTVSYLVVAGGGGGGTNTGGGGGGGGLVTGSTILQPANTYSITIGAGGIGGLNAATPAYNGGNTTAFGFTAVGGGAAGSSVSGYNNGSNGGSGGGATGRIGTYTGGSATVSQGYAGGNTTSSTGGAGGGGAGQAGFNGTATNNGGNGGNGASYSISGTATYYAGGGGGGGVGSSTVGTGGLGGGGAGANPPAPSYNTQATGVAGTANLGGGGGGGGDYSSNGGNGGSGVVIISYSGAQQFGGGVVSSAGGNTIHTFYTSGSLVPLTSLSASYLTVAGGGGGGSLGGGGGAGGLLSGSNVTIDSNSSYIITVGAGGVGAVNGSQTSYATNGGNSSFSAVANVAIGGGYGGSDYGGAQNNGGSGGSGGGVELSSYTPGSGTAGQGYGGGLGSSSGLARCGGGGGAGEAGFASATNAGAGGNGVSSSISGTATYYAGGGGGGANSGSGGSAGAGGLGGGGAGTASTTTATAGTANTGGGGGGGGYTSPTYATGGAGGSGVVIISYPGSTPMMAGGNVTVVSNTVVHTFTSSGYLTPFVNFNNSLRFRSSASAYLNRTPPSAGNRQTATFSWWMKRGSVASDQVVFSLGAYPTNLFEILFLSDNTLYIQNTPNSTTRDLFLQTSQVFRDPAAWYHIVLAIDTTQATSSNRAKLYVNGSQVTAFSSATYPSQNTNLNMNTAVSTQIGRRADGNYYQDAYLTEFNFIDGQALTPNAFGSFNQYGVWAPVRYAGSYGTNGFYLPFAAGTSAYAGNFNGSNQSLQLGGQSTFAFGTNDFTVEAWIYTTSNTVGAIYDGRPTSTNGAYPLLYFQSTALTYDVNASDVIQVTNFPTNQWVHIALVRASGTTRIYVNGVASGAAWSDSTTYLNGASRPLIGKAGYVDTAFFGGAISNLRVVNGTAVYTGNFTPPTTALTAITNTVLLTLQNSTIIDNSTNGYTITNNNSVATGQTYPFGLNIAKDASPQGNNWTPNNIGGQSGSTLDYMVDVPTLTSANVANYCVGNPLDTSTSITFSDGNLKASDSVDNWKSARCTIGVSSGKWYWEVTVNGAPASSQYTMLGVMQNNDSLGTYMGDTAGGYGYNAANGNKYHNSTDSAYGASYTTGDVIGVALDLDAGTLTFYKNNTSQGTAYTGLSGTFFPAISMYTTGGTVSNYFNFGQQPFKYTPPAGYLPLNTYNM